MANTIIRGSKALGNSNDAIDFDTKWAVLASSLREIHTKNASMLSFEELYRNAYQLVLKKRGESLYERVKEFEEAWLKLEVRPRILAVISSALLVGNRGPTAMTTTDEKRVAGERLLKALKQAWEDHNICMNMTTDVLMYMDRVYCTDNRKPSIFTASMAQFRDHVLRSPVPAHGNKSIATFLYSVIMDQIHMERDGDIIDKALIRSCVYMLEGLYESEEEEEDNKLYLTSFEPEFLDASRRFYEGEGKTLLRQADAGTFCRHTMRRVTEEQDRCRSTLSPLTSPKIKAVIEDELIRNNIREVIELQGSGVKCMLDDDRLEELQMIYELISRVDPRKEELSRAVQRRIVELGTEINTAAMNNSQAQPTNCTKQDSDKAEGDGKASEKPMNLQTAAAIRWVDDVLQLKQKYDTVLLAAFHSDQGLQTALSRSFTDFINVFERSSEFLSLFFDENMKKGIKGKTENEVDALLDKGITLLRYVQDKDMFERYYKKHLSRRLLMKRSISMDAERQMISKMKMEVGNTFTQKIEAMFKDMAVSEDLSSNFKKHVARLGDPDPKRAELDIHVLTSTMWPLEAMAPTYYDGEGRPMCIFPPQIERVKHGFEKFYLDKHSGRRLTWQANMGTADIRAYFPESKGKIKTRELNVSTYAMVILLLFNDLPPGESYTCEELQARTNMPLNELTRNLQSLAVAAKTRILIKEPMSKDIKLSDKFFFNESFYSQFTKIKIGVVTSGNKVEDQDERKETEKKNDESRGGSIEAAIVRIMKQRKELSHQKLITEVIQQLTTRFMPDVNMVKKRIESLIEREYLERVEDSNRPAYRYLA
ncbi:Winged helix-turn-helix DNA-binding domain [Lasallia pustulata]|uniref:Winged helix-turn-helix DNA-binding domain n=1 Tax=Lasallia pustulata TaxID=136370 RepID=A0A1W5CYV0_9LECA|nr:Winged helix-turn-helix DNA-binding domain [Lasallia pustulata]